MMNMHLDLASVRRGDDNDLRNGSQALEPATSLRNYCIFTLSLFMACT